MTYKVQNFKNITTGALIFLQMISDRFASFNTFRFVLVKQFFENQIKHVKKISNRCKECKNCVKNSTQGSDLTYTTCEIPDIDKSSSLIQFIYNVTQSLSSIEETWSTYRDDGLETLFYINRKLYVTYKALVAELNSFTKTYKDLIKSSFEFVRVVINAFWTAQLKLQQNMKKIRDFFAEMDNFIEEGLTTNILRSFKVLKDIKLRRNNRTCIRLKSIFQNFSYACQLFSNEFHFDMSVPLPIQTTDDELAAAFSELYLFYKNLKKCVVGVTNSSSETIRNNSMNCTDKVNFIFSCKRSLKNYVAQNFPFPASWDGICTVFEEYCHKFLDPTSPGTFLQ